MSLSQTDMQTQFNFIPDKVSENGRYIYLYIGTHDIWKILKTRIFKSLIGKIDFCDLSNNQSQTENDEFQINQSIIDT